MKKSRFLKSSFLLLVFVLLLSTQNVYAGIITEDKTFMYDDCTFVSAQIGKLGVLLATDHAGGDKKSHGVQLEVPPLIKDGVTLVSVRFVTNHFDSKVEWNGDTRQVKINKGDINIVLTIDSTEAYVNGQLVQLEVPATIINGNTMVPVRFITESMHFDVYWDEKDKIVYIEHPSCVKNKYIGVVGANMHFQTTKDLKSYYNTYLSITDEQKTQIADNLKNNNIKNTPLNITIERSDQNGADVKIEKFVQIYDLQGKLTQQHNVYQTYHLVFKNDRYAITSIDTTKMENVPITP